MVTVGAAVVQLLYTKLSFWGIALLAAFTLAGGNNIGSFLDGIFENAEKNTVAADEAEINSFASFMTKYKGGLVFERLASEVLYNA